MINLIWLLERHEGEIFFGENLAEGVIFMVYII